MIQPNHIKPKMLVVCSDHGRFAVVDQMQDDRCIKLAKDKSGQHHYIPLSWVETVDDRVHLGRPATLALKDWFTTPPALDL